MVSNPVGESVIHLSVLCGVVDIIAVALRLLARWRSKAAFAVDDALIIASLIPLNAMIAIDYLSVELGGMGLPTAVNLELGHGPSRISALLKLMMAGIVTYTLTITIVKLSILVLYRRIFSTLAFKRSTLVVGAAVIIWFIVALFTDLFQCRPFHAAFDPELLFTEQCINLQAYYWGITASNLCLDLVMLYMPLHMVWGLKLRTRQKVALSGIFLLGGIVCVAGAMRIVTVGTLQKEDLTYTIASQYKWSQLETALAIHCSCLVTLRPLFVDIKLNISKYLSRFSRTKNPSSSKITTSEDSSPERRSHCQWPTVQDFRNTDTTKLSSKGTSPEAGVHIVNIDLGTTGWDAPYAQISGSGSGNGGDIRDQQPSSSR